MTSHDDDLRVETIAVLKAVEVAVVGFSELFGGVAQGVPVDPTHAVILSGQCSELLARVAEIRNDIRLSGSSWGVH